jgi:hypothetical protein
MTDASHAVVLKPGDTLLIGNLGQTSDDALDALHEGLAKLRSALGLGDVFVFERDIDAAALTPIAPLPDAAVVRVFDREALRQHRDALGPWLKVNGIDPEMVADEWLSIEEASGQRFIRYPAFRLTQDGRRLIDPRLPDRAWTVERVSPLIIDLDLASHGARDGG